MIPLRPGCVQRCPGCSHRELSAAESEAQKFAWLSLTLEPWREALVSIRSVSGEARWGYRGKSCLRAEWREREWRIGLRIRDREGNEEVIDIPECPVHSPFVRSVVAALKRILPPGERFPLAFVLVSGKFVTLVIKAKECRETDWVEKLDPASLGVAGVFLNMNPVAGQRVLSHGGWRLVWGKERDFFPIASLQAEIAYGPDSFGQLISSLYEESLEQVRAFLVPGKSSSVVDICSGIGISLRMWKEAGAETLGVELGEESVACADINAGIGHCLRGRASERLPQLSEWASKRAGIRLAYANPPRLGLEPEVTAWLAREFRPERMAYLSCSAGTLLRDLSVLADSGYCVRKIIPYDFFPQTRHVEALALLERRPG